MFVKGEPIRLTTGGPVGNPRHTSGDLMGNEWLIHGRKCRKLVYLSKPPLPSFESRKVFKPRIVGERFLTYQRPPLDSFNSFTVLRHLLTIFRWRTSTTTTVTTPHLPLPKSSTRIHSCSPRHSPLQGIFIPRKRPPSPVVGPRSTSQDSWSVHQTFP